MDIQDLCLTCEKLNTVDALKAFTETISGEIRKVQSSCVSVVSNREGDFSLFHGIAPKDTKNSIRLYTGSTRRIRMLFSNNQPTNHQECVNTQLYPLLLLCADIRIVKDVCTVSAKHIPLLINLRNNIVEKIIRNRLENGRTYEEKLRRIEKNELASMRTDKTSGIEKYTCFFTESAGFSFCMNRNTIRKYWSSKPWSVIPHAFLVPRSGSGFYEIPLGHDKFTDTLSAAQKRLFLRHHRYDY